MATLQSDAKAAAVQQSQPKGTTFQVDSIIEKLLEVCIYI